MGHRRKTSILAAAGVVIATVTAAPGDGCPPASARPPEPRGTRSPISARWVVLSFSGALGVNNRGQATGFSGTNGDAGLRGFVWKGGVMRYIGTLGGPLSVGGDINSSGQIAAGQHTTAAPRRSSTRTRCSAARRPFPTRRRWRVTHFCGSRGTKTDLGALGGSNSAAENRGLNEAGHVVGTAETTAADPTSPYGGRLSTPSSGGAGRPRTSAP